MIVAELLFAALVLAISAFLVTMAVRAIRERMRIARWPRVEAA